MFNVIKMKMVM